VQVEEPVLYLEFDGYRVSIEVHFVPPFESWVAFYR